MFTINCRVPFFQVLRIYTIPLIIKTNRGLSTAVLLLKHQLTAKIVVLSTNSTKMPTLIYHKGIIFMELKVFTIIKVTWTISIHRQHISMKGIRQGTFLDSYRKLEVNIMRFLRLLRSKRKQLSSTLFLNSFLERKKIQI